MKSALTSLAIALICVAAVSAQTAEGTTVTAAAPDISAAIRLFEAWLQSHMTDRQLPGVSVGVVHDQHLLWAKGFGYADIESKTPMTPKTLFRMASNTKPFTALAVMQLRDAGRLRLDDPVSQYLPWMKMQSSGRDVGRPVTIEHLLTHGSGLPREPGSSSYWNTLAFPSAQDVRTAVPGQKLAYEPETRLKYSNLGFALAGMVVEAVSDVSYAEWMQRRVLAPLGMTASGIDRNVEGLASGYGRRMPGSSREKIPFFPTHAIAPAAGLTSNIEDLSRFVSLQFRRGRAGGPQEVVAGATLAEMHRVRFIDANWRYGFGLGFATVRVKDQSYIGHGGHLPGFRTQISFLPDSKVGVIVLTNADDGRAHEIAQTAHDIIGAAVAKTVPPVKKLWDDSWRRYAGRYRNAVGDLYVVALKDELLMFDPALGDPVEQGAHVIPQPDGTFLLEEKTGGWEIGEPVTFIEKGGRIEAVLLGTFRYERAE